MWTIFKVFTECVTISLLFFMFCFGLFDHEVCGISAPGLGIEPTPPTLEGKVLTTGPLGKPHPMGVLTVGSEGWDLLRLSSPHTLLMDLCPCGFLHWVPPPSPPQSALCTAAVSPLPYPAHSCPSPKLGRQGRTRPWRLPSALPSDPVSPDQVAIGTIGLF